MNGRIAPANASGVRISMSPFRSETAQQVGIDTDLGGTLVVPAEVQWMVQRFAADATSASPQSHGPAKRAPPRELTGGKRSRCPNKFG